MFKQGNVYYKLRHEAQVGDEFAANQLWVHFIQQIIHEDDDKWVLSQEQPERSHHSQRRMDFLLKRFRNDYASQGHLGTLQVVLVAESKKHRAPPADIKTLETQVFEACCRVLSEDEKQDWVWALTIKGPEGRLWACHHDADLLEPIYPNSHDYGEKSLYIDIAHGFRERLCYIRDNPIPTNEMMIEGSGVATDRLAAFTPNVGVYVEGPPNRQGLVFTDASKTRELVMGSNYYTGSTVATYPAVSTSSWSTPVAGPSYTEYGPYESQGGDDSMDIDQQSYNDGSHGTSDTREGSEQSFGIPEVSSSEYEKLESVCRFFDRGRNKWMTRGTTRGGKPIELPYSYWKQAMIVRSDRTKTNGLIAERTSNKAKYWAATIEAPGDGGGKGKGKETSGRRHRR